MDWAENDRICTAVLFHLPLKRKRETVLIVEAPAPQPVIEYRDRVIVKEVPSPPRIEYRDRVVEVPRVEYRDRVVEVPVNRPHRFLPDAANASPPPGYSQWASQFKPHPQPGSFTTEDDGSSAYPPSYG